MLPLTLLAAALGLNYRQHRLDRPTICSTLRPHIGPWEMTGLVVGGAAWFLPHYCRPFWRTP